MIEIIIMCKNHVICKSDGVFGNHKKEINDTIKR